jgi:drug/metabolite transporter (DMT)-like permease
MNSSTKQPITLAGFLITFLGSVLFSTKAVIVKKAFIDIQTDAVSLLTTRMIFSLPFFVAAAFLTSGKKENTPLTKKQWTYIILLGLVGYYLSSLLDFIGLQYISAGLERLILFLYPTFTVLINAVIFRLKVSRVQGLALFLTYCGLGIAYLSELHGVTINQNFFFGSFMILLCAITFSIYIVGSGRLIPQVGATKFTAYAMLASTGGILVHFLIGGNRLSVNQNSSYYWYGLLLAIVATVIPSFLISNGMKRIGSNNVAIISSIGPVSTILLAHFVLGEPVSFMQFAGTGLVIVGVALIGWNTK